MSKGKFIVFEGTDGAGKTTLLNKVKEELEQHFAVLQTREPGGTRIGKEIRRVLLDLEDSPTLSDTTQLMLFAASYRDALTKDIIPQLNNGGYVISDRTNISSFVYQRKSKYISMLTQINDDLCVPDLVFILTTDYETMKQRISDRGEVGNYKDYPSEEQHNFLVEGYKLYAEMYPRRTIVLNANLNPDQIFEAAMDAIAERFWS